MKKINLVCSLIVLTVLSACSTNQSDDLKEWMDKSSKNMRGKIDQIEDAKNFVAIDFNAKQSPFVMKETISLLSLAKMKYAPDNNRRKEPMESYQLDSIKMVGFLYKDNKETAILKTKDNLIHYVQKGNYIGINYGLIKSISESEIVLEERVNESDEWKLRSSTVNLDDGTKSK